MIPERFYLACDDDGHWFVVPVSKREAFDEWLSQDWENELSDFQTPNYATEINNPHYVTFENPEDELS